MPTPTPDELAVVARVLADLPAIDIVFDGPPDAQPGRFVEVELADTKAGVSVGAWVERPSWTQTDLWVLPTALRHRRRGVFIGGEQLNEHLAILAEQRRRAEVESRDLPVGAPHPGDGAS